MAGACERGDRGTRVVRTDRRISNIHDPAEGPGVTEDGRDFRRRHRDAGISVPTGEGGHPWRAARRRPKLVSFLLRLFT